VKACAAALSQRSDSDHWHVPQFQVPDAAELDGGEIPAPPAGWPGRPEWAADHWPTCNIE